MLVGLLPKNPFVIFAWLIRRRAGRLLLLNAFALGHGLLEEILNLAINAAQFVLRPRFELSPKRGVDSQ